MAKNEICHIEWNVTDLPRARTFYEGLFGWKFQDFMGDMVIFGSGDKHIGGLTRVDDVTPGTSPTVWFEVDDIDVYFQKAVAVGGSKGGEKNKVPNVGWSATVCDPDGNFVGLVQFDRS